MFYFQAVGISGFLGHWDFRRERLVGREVKYVDLRLSLHSLSPGSTAV